MLCTGIALVDTCYDHVFLCKKKRAGWVFNVNKFNFFISCFPQNILCFICLLVFILATVLNQESTYILNVCSFSNIYFSDLVNNGPKFFNNNGLDFFAHSNALH